MVDVYVKTLKSLATETTEDQFNVFVQQLFKTYENVSLKPKALAKELRLSLIEAHKMPLFQKNQLLPTIRFAEFQHFCRSYFNQMRVKSIMQGNLDKEKAISIMKNVMNILDCNRIENVSQTLIHMKVAQLGIFGISI